MISFAPMRWILFVILVAACTESQDDPQSSRTAARTLPDSDRRAAQPSAPMVRQVAVTSFKLVPGKPGAFEVQATDGWPGRALDPVLAIGNETFREYDFSARDTIRFVIPDTSALPDGAAVHVQYG